MDYYEFLGGYQATLFGAKSKMKTTQNAHNSPLLFFLYETLDLSDKVRQRKENFRPQAISKNQFENFRKN